MREENFQAFLRVIRTGEGTLGKNGYRVLFGGGLFDSFADHPHQIITRKLGKKEISSSAAGAYQVLWKTWLEAKRALSLTDFTPESQDRIARFLITRRGALMDVLEGRFCTAVRKCNKEWASLPESPYGQPTLTMKRALAIYLAAGGESVEEA